MPGFVLHPGAATDVGDIWEYIAGDNLGAADRVLAEIYEAIQSLSAFLTKNTSVQTVVSC
jgi:plasmid stabilization system protein ParE